MGGCTKTDGEVVLGVGGDDFDCLLRCGGWGEGETAGRLTDGLWAMFDDVDSSLRGRSTAAATARLTDELELGVGVDVKSDALDGSGVEFVLFWRWTLAHGWPDLGLEEEWGWAVECCLCN